jgi:predicted dehydrogenase
MPRKVRVALAGLGSVSQRGILPHLAQPDALERVELVACCDVVPDRARETARRFGWAEHYDDYDEMLARADVEAVLLATPIPLHYEQTIKALHSGRHVYVQKTMTTTLAEANDVLALVERTGRTFVASPGQMLNPTNQQIKRLVDDGALGKLYWAFSTNAGGGHEFEAFRAGDDVLRNVDPTWYYKPGGGPVYDMAVYSLHTLTGILGPARAVTALSGIGRPERQWKDKTITVEMDDNTLMLLDFGDATFAVAGGQNCGVSPGIGWGRLAFFGTRGTIDMGQAVGGLEIISQATLPEALGFAAPRLVVPTPPGQSRLQYVVGPHTNIQEPHVYNDIMHLCDCIVDGREPVASGAHARHVVEIIEKAYLAARTGATQTLESTF